MDIWLMTDPMFWVTLGAWSGFCTGLFTGALITLWRIKTAKAYRPPGK
jgi:hypothetical protein